MHPYITCQHWPHQLQAKAKAEALISKQTHVVSVFAIHKHPGSSQLQTMHIIKLLHNHPLTRRLAL